MVTEIFSMHGYGAYVWGSYGITLLVLGLNVYFAKKHQRKILSRIH